MATEKYTLAEILEYGPLVAVDEDYMVAVTVNGAYANFWPMNGDGTFGNAFTVLYQEKDMYERTAADLWDEGKRALEWLQGQNEDEEEDIEEEDTDGEEEEDGDEGKPQGYWSVSLESDNEENGDEDE